MSAEPLHIYNLSLTETDNVHKWMRTLFQSFGINGHELDEAISAAFRSAVASIDNHRQAKLDADDDKKQGRSHLRLVK